MPADHPSAFSPRQLVRSAMSLVLPRSMYMVHGPRGGRGGNKICVTFDDGPHPINTPRLLDALRSHQAKATFFVIGREAERYPDMLRRIVDEGHELGHHTFHHARPDTVSAAQLAEELRQTADVVERATGTAMRLFRPPWGKLTAAKFATVWRAGLSVVLWNVDPKDCSQPNTAAVLRWFDRHPTKPGDVVLMHDDMPYGDAVIPRLIERFHGREMVTVSEMIRRRATRGVRMAAAATRPQAAAVAA